MLRAKASSAPEISVLLEQARARLTAAGIETSQLDAQVLLADAAHTDRAALVAGRIELTPEIIARFEAFVARRVAREPVAYILGRRDFYSLEFEVNTDVLIPRPHTETVVDTALEFIAGRPQARVLEIGTGPGPIAIAIAANAPQVSVTATDLSADALQVARRNAARNGVAERVSFVRANIFQPLDAAMLPDTFELIVSNPPYIIDREIAGLEPDVREFEPHLALRGGDDGLDFFRRIAAGAKPHLEKDGLLVLEVGAGQDTAVAKILEKAGMRPARVINDLDGIARVVTARP
jgi:release factor glutamine methyltransferase